MADRPRYNDLTKRLRLAIRNRSENSLWLHFQTGRQVLSLPQVADWISMERPCCPFLAFQLSASGNESDCVLALTGPEGVKALLKAEFLEVRRVE